LNDLIVVVITHRARDSARTVTKCEGANFVRCNSLRFFENGFGSSDGLENALLEILAEIDVRDQRYFVDDRSDPISGVCLVD
jgi:hypothetical protein